MIYSQSKHTNLFFLVPFKCGWSSFYTLNENGNLINAKKYYHDIEKQKVWVDVFLIRNPYQRIVSIFKDKFKQSILKQDFEQDIQILQL